jgi:signal transduction histidine kinase
MGTAVDSVLTRLHPLIEEKNIVVTKEIAPDPIFIDGGDLETILYNLVHNAVKFSRESGAVRIVWREGILTIANKGAGISEEALPYIFDRFYTTGSVESGMGLGLSLVQEVVRRYAGTIQATSTPGTWTEFCITF